MCPDNMEYIDNKKSGHVHSSKSRLRRGRTGPRLGKAGQGNGCGQEQCWAELSFSACKQFQFNYIVDNLTGIPFVF